MFKIKVSSALVFSFLCLRLDLDFPCTSGWSVNEKPTFFSVRSHGAQALGVQRSGGPQREDSRSACAYIPLGVRIPPSGNGMPLVASPWTHSFGADAPYMYDLDKVDRVRRILAASVRVWTQNVKEGKLTSPVSVDCEGWCISGRHHCYRVAVVVQQGLLFDTYVPIGDLEGAIVTRASKWWFSNFAGENFDTAKDFSGSNLRDANKVKIEILRLTREVMLLFGTLCCMSLVFCLFCLLRGNERVHVLFRRQMDCARDPRSSLSEGSS